MNGYNKVFLIGNIGKDAELKHTPTGKANSTFSLATTETWYDDNKQKQSKTEWHNIVQWGRAAESICQYLTKGRAVFVEGKISTRSWEDKDGNKRYKTEIIASVVNILDFKGEKKADDGYRTGEATDQEQGQPAAGGQSAAPSDDDIPF